MAQGREPLGHWCEMATAYFTARDSPVEFPRHSSQSRQLGMGAPTGTTLPAVVSNASATQNATGQRPNLVLTFSVNHTAESAGV